MTQQEKEIMFLYLNDVLVKFWIEQGRPDKEVRIELIEKMLNWYKKMANVIPDGQSKEPVSEDLEEAAEEYKQGEVDTNVDYHDDTGEPLCFMEALKPAFIAGAEWQKSKMLEDVIDATVRYVGKAHYVIPNDEQFKKNIKRFKDEDKVKVIVVKEDK